MSNHTPTPNEDGPRQADNPSTPRNDPAIDPQGDAPAGGGKKGPGTTPEENTYSPDFAPETQPGDANKPKDADIDTDGG